MFVYWRRKKIYKKSFIYIFNTKRERKKKKELKCKKKKSNKISEKNIYYI